MTLENPGSKQDTTGLDKEEKARIANNRHDALKNYKLNNQTQLVRRATKENEEDLLVAMEYDAFLHIQKAHLDLECAGVNKTFAEVKKRVYGITRNDCKWLLAHCQNCLVNQQSKTRAPLQPIVATEVMERV